MIGPRAVAAGDLIVRRREGPRMSRRTFSRLLGAGVLLGLVWVRYAWWRGERVVGPYHSVELGMSRDESS